MYYAPGYVSLDHANENLIIGKNTLIEEFLYESHERPNMLSGQISV